MPSFFSKLKQRASRRKSAQSPPPQQASSAPTTAPAAPAAAATTTTEQPTSKQASGADASASKQASSEPTYTIQPHPAKSNDPADLAPAQPGSRTTDPFAAQKAAPGPYIPSEQVKNSLEQPKSREELRARAEELNK